MTRIAIIAAMPGELKPLVRGWPHSTRNGIHFWAQRTAEEEWIAACAGAGQPAATRAFAAIEDGGPIDLVFSIGWAGALRAEIATGSAHNVAGVIDAAHRRALPLRCRRRRSLARHQPQGRQSCREAPTRRQLTMPPSSIWRPLPSRVSPPCAAFRFTAIKGVSDGLHDRLPDFNPFLTADGRFRLIPFTLLNLFRPWYWPALLRMGENSKRASQSIAESLVDFLDGQSLDE